MPDVVGADQARGRAGAARRGLRRRRSRPRPPTSRAATVIGQDPAGGTKAEQGLDRDAHRLRRARAGARARPSTADGAQRGARKQLTQARLQGRRAASELRRPSAENRVIEHAAAGPGDAGRQGRDGDARRLAAARSRSPCPTSSGKTRDDARATLRGRRASRSPSREQESADAGPGHGARAGPAPAARRRRRARRSTLDGRQGAAARRRCPTSTGETEDDADRRALRRRLQGRARTTQDVTDAGRGRHRADQSPARRARPRRARRVTITVGRFNPDPTPRRRRRPTTPATTSRPTTGDAVRVAVLSGGRSSEHDVSLAVGGRRCATACARRATRSLDVSSPATATWRTTARSWRCAPGRGLLGADVVVPGAARPVRRGRHGAGPARAARRALRRLRRAGQRGCAWTRSSSRTSWRTPGVPQVAYVGCVDARRATAGRRVAALGLPVLGQAGAARLVGRDRPRSPAPSELGRRARRGVRPRPARDRRGDAHRARGRVLGARPHDARRRPAEPGEIVLLERAGWYDYEAKYTPGGMELVVPARISRGGARARARAGGRRRSALAGCSGLARVDFFVDGDDVLLNELNTMPGFTADERLRRSSGRRQRPALPASSSTASCALGVERHAARARATRF